MQVEPNARKIQEHQRKYERLRKEQGPKRVERDKQRQQAKAVSTHNRDIDVIFHEKAHLHSLN